MRALVIDDSKTMRMIVSKILREGGFEIFEAIHGRAGLERLAETGPLDLVLVDWNMPEMNGYEFLLAVRAEPRFDDMRVMMVTTETEIEHMLQALAAGANEYVMKPFTKDSINEKLSLMGMQLAGLDEWRAAA